MRCIAFSCMVLPRIVLHSMAWKGSISTRYTNEIWPASTECTIHERHPSSTNGTPDKNKWNPKVDTLQTQVKEHKRTVCPFSTTTSKCLAHGERSVRYAFENAQRMGVGHTGHQMEDRVESSQQPSR